MYSTANNTWFNGMSEHDLNLQQQPQQQQPTSQQQQQQQQQQQSSSSPTILTTYNLNSGEMISTTTLDPYRVANDNTGSTNTFYMSYPNAVGDSEHDEHDLEESDEDDEDDEDSLYQLPKRHTNHSTAASANKNGTQRRNPRPNGSKRKRKRVLNGVQRAEATQREKRRMLKLNRAFEDLRKVLPVTEFARNKLSRSETLKSAIDYINLMFDMLDSAKGHHHHHHHNHYQQ